MAAEIKAILLDVDGTLTNDAKDITPRTRDALLKCQEKGVVLVLASGRTANGLSRYAAELQMERHGGVLVCFNGAKSLNCETGRVYFEQSMTVEQGKRVLEHMKKFNVAPVVDHGEYMYVNNCFFTITRPDGSTWHILEYEAHSNNYKLCEKHDLAKYVDWRINKILNAGQPEYLQEVWQDMAAPFEGELSAMLAAVLGITPDQVISFGDAQNDLTMIKWAKIGVAMGNAAPEVREQADYVTGSNNEDGIADALEHLVPELLA